MAIRRSVPSAARVQDALLEQILAEQADTAFGRDHGFPTIRTLADYRRQVPIAAYERFRAVHRTGPQRRDSARCSPIERVLMFALTSGTTAARKTIPITPRYLNDYRRGWNRWGLRALLDHQRISCSPILQVAGDPEEYRTEAGIPCGSLSGLTVRMQKRIHSLSLHVSRRRRARFAITPPSNTSHCV